MGFICFNNCDLLFNDRTLSFHRELVTNPPYESLFEKAESSRKPETSPIKLSKHELFGQPNDQEPERSVNAHGFSLTGRGRNGKPVLMTQRTSEVRAESGKSGEPGGEMAGGRAGQRGASKALVAPAPPTWLRPSLGPDSGAGHAALRVASSLRPAEGFLSSLSFGPLRVVATDLPSPPLRSVSPRSSLPAQGRARAPHPVKRPSPAPPGGTRGSVSLHGAALWDPSVKAKTLCRTSDLRTYASFLKRLSRREYKYS